MNKFVIVVFLSVILFGCTSDDSVNLDANDYLIFGHFYGFCVGESCIETFKLTSDTLYEDSNDNYASGPFDFDVLNDTKFEQVKSLINAFPTKLLTEKETTLGCPDCLDGGGIYIEYSKNGVVKSWKIDQMKYNVPEYLHAFMDAVNGKISLINE